MKLDQLQDFKRWHVGHAALSPLELMVCDAVLALWVLGWGVLPLTLVLGEPEWLPLSFLLTVMPDAYRGLRAALHRRGLLRCDWLHAVRPHPPA